MDVVCLLGAAQTSLLHSRLLLPPGLCTVPSGKFYFVNIFITGNCTKNILFRVHCTATFLCLNLLSKIVVLIVNDDY